MQTKIRKIGDILQSKIDHLSGNWILPSTGYEKKFCEKMGFDLKVGRYADAIFQDTHIELKKGQAGMWFDMTRYAEIYLKIGLQNTLTIFLHYDKREMFVKQIYIINTKKLIQYLKLDTASSKMCLAMKDLAPRQLNIQANATNVDLRNMSDMIIKSTREKKKNNKRKR
tara:strand:+ start:354 stop:860 length:507 start_codon:yes stop_codon:yes gene_type:complete